MRIHKRWRGFFQTLLNKKSPILDLTTTVLLTQRPLAPSLGVEPTMDDILGVIRGMPNWKAVGPDFLPAEVLKLDHPEFIRYFHNLLVNVWSTGEVPQQWKYATIKVLHKKKDRSDCNNYRGISQELPRDFACCPLRQSIAENGSICLLYTSPSPRD